MLNRKASLYIETTSKVENLQYFPCVIAKKSQYKKEADEQFPIST